MGELFVGRRPELELLHGALADAAAGRPRVVLVDGAAGMGKSALLQRFLRCVQDPVVLTASGDENEAALPYALVDQLTRGLPVEAPPILKSLADPSRPVTDSLAVGAGMVELLDALQERGPVVVAVDDLQWSDGPSVHALVFTLRRLRAEAVLTLLTARTEALADLPAGLHRVVESQLGVTVHLDGLRMASVDELARRVGSGPLPPEAVRRLHDHTAGSPLHLRALLEELSVDELLVEELPAPRSFGAIVLSRLAACSPDAEQVLAAAAVLGHRGPLRLCGQVAQVDDPRTAVQGALTSGLVSVRPPADGEEIAFSHPLVRAAIYHDLPPARRATLHARAADAVESEALAWYHRAQTVDKDPNLAAEVARFARREATRGAMASAAASFRMAARLVPRGPLWEQLVLETIEASLLAGDHPQAATLARDIEGFANSPRRRYTNAHLCLISGRQAEAETLLTAAWEESDPDPDRVLAARIASLLATILLNEGRAEQAVVWARRALSADPAATSTVDARWLVTVGLAASGREREALATVEGLPEGPLEPDPGQATGLAARGVVRLWTDALAPARSDLTRAMDLCRRRGPFHIGVIASFYLSDTEYRLGAWDDAILHGEAAVSAVEDAEQSWQLALVHAVAAFPLAGRGLWEAAQRHVRAAQEAAQMLGNASNLVWAGVARARLATAAGDPRAVVDALEPVATCASEHQAVDEPGIQPWRELLADALVSLGRPEQAEAVLARLEEVATARGRKSSLAAAMRVRGNLEAARGKRSEAETAYTCALRQLEDLAMPLERALAEEAYGRLLRRAGKRRDAALHLTRAAEGFGRLGARPFTERCQGELAACGVGGGNRLRTGIENLTTQELAVAQRAAAGLRNRDIARELLISVKTVEYHLGNVFTKLGIHSRAQLHARLDPPR